MKQPAHGGNLTWAAALAGCHPRAILDFSASISPLGPPSSVLDAIASQMDSLRHYPDPNYPQLRVSLSNYHQLPPEWILPGNGSAELLTWAGRELAKLATTVLITPAFGDYYRALMAYDAQLLEFPLSLGGKYVPNQGRGEKELFSSVFSLDSLPQACSGKWGLLINNPHNPTGKLFSREEILPLLSEFALVVVDEAFMDFLPPESEQSLVALVPEYANLVVLRSLTKFYSLPGLRLGYAIAHPERLRRWQQWRDPWSVNSLAVAAAIAAVGDRQFQQQTWNWLPKTRNQLCQGLMKIPGLLPMPSAANFLLVESQISCVHLQQKLLQNYQIFIRDCQSFPELGDRFFRIAVRTEVDNQRLLTALDEMG